MTELYVMVEWVYADVRWTVCTQLESVHHSCAGESMTMYVLAERFPPELSVGRLPST